MDQSARTGREKIRVLEELMSGTGIFSEDFSCGLGDFLEVDDHGDDPKPPLPDDPPRDPPKKATAKDPFPAVDGPLSTEEFVGRYKKAILSRQGAFGDIHSKWVAANPATGSKLVLTMFFLWDWYCDVVFLTPWPNG